MSSNFGLVYAKTVTFRKKCHEYNIMQYCISDIFCLNIFFVRFTVFYKNGKCGETPFFGGKPPINVKFRLGTRFIGFNILELCFPTWLLQINYVQVKCDRFLPSPSFSSSTSSLLRSSFPPPPSSLYLQLIYSNQECFILQYHFYVISTRN